MSERYPSDAMLLSLTQDSHTGVEYIATGRSPYFLEFRRLLYRLLLATGRANDLRVYQDGDLTIGVRSGRCCIGGAGHLFPGVAAQSVAADAVTSIYLDADAALQITTEGFPTDRTTFLPLAAVVAGTGSITTITDLRGETFLHAPSTAGLGLTAAAEQINQALDGIDPAVTALNLNALCAGSMSSADAQHRHAQFAYDVDGEATFGLVNSSADAAANVTLRLGLLSHLADYTHLLVNKASGFFRQRYDGVTHDLLGSVHVQCAFAGPIVASQTGVLAGVVPVTGRVTDVVLSLGTNIVSDVGGDGLTATAKVNGTTLCTVDPAITTSDGAGFRSTDQGDGTAATVRSDGPQQVSRGDVLTVDLTRSAAGTISTEPADVVVLFVIRNNRPE